ncbi:MAG: Gmad2 immunoglobulin-like domain-containing protein [Acidimicrobiia bacterium]
MFVDLHLNSPAAARARVEESPARLTVDLRPGLVEFDGQSSLGRSAVIVAPGAGSDVATATLFSGYVRFVEADVAVIVTQGSGVTDQTSTIAADHVETWGQFATELTLPPGEVSVFFGGVDPEDGGLDGVTVDLTVG